MTKTSAIVCAVALAYATGCGSEKTFGPEEFVAEANRNGAGIELGESLISPGPEREVFELELVEGTKGGTGHLDGDDREDRDHDEPGHAGGGEEHSHLGGSLTVTPDPDAGRAEFERCDSAVSLLCYRAANVVVAFENALPGQLQARVRAAIVAMGTE